MILPIKPFTLDEKHIHFPIIRTQEYSEWNERFWADEIELFEINRRRVFE